MELTHKTNGYTSQSGDFKMSRFFIVFFAVIAAIDSSAKASYAYLDPGAGSQLIQMTLAGALGLIFALKTTFQRFLQVARARRSK
nr:hypothetical protein [Armatimonas sp.]